MLPALTILTSNLMSQFSSNRAQGQCPAPRPPFYTGPLQCSLDEAPKTVQTKAQYDATTQKTKPYSTPSLTDKLPLSDENTALFGVRYIGVRYKDDSSNTAQKSDDNIRKYRIAALEATVEQWESNIQALSKDESKLIDSSVQTKARLAPLKIIKQQSEQIRKSAQPLR